MSRSLRIPTLLLALAGASCAAHADQLVTLTVQNHTFSPSSFTVPAGERFRIQLTNHDDGVDEFESYDMKFEKIVVPGNTITVFAGPMHPGTYSFFDDYHPDQAKGTVTAVEAKE